MKQWCTKHYTMYEASVGCLDCVPTATTKSSFTSDIFTFGINLVDAKPTVGKSTFCYAVASHILQGKKNLVKYSLPNPGNLLFVADSPPGSLVIGMGVSNFAPSGSKNCHHFRTSRILKDCLNYAQLDKVSYIIIDLESSLVTADLIDEIRKYSLQQNVVTIITRTASALGYQPPLYKIDNLLEMMRTPAAPHTWVIQRTYRGNQTDLRLTRDYEILLFSTIWLLTSYVATLSCNPSFI